MHQDDETVGCGGIIQKFIKGGSKVHVVYGTVMNDTTTYRKFDKVKGEYINYTGKTRKKETQDALKVLGVGSDTLHSMFDDKFHHRLDTLPICEVVGTIERLIRAFRPDIILVPSPSTNQDHTALYNATLVACRPHFFNGSVIAYEVCGETDFKPNMYVPLEDDEIEKKLDAFGMYKTQHSGDLHLVSEEGIRVKAMYRGKESYYPFAEAFEIIRMSFGGDS